jgi:riboflavin kinase/FMN adenylyltransferase
VEKECYEGREISSTYIKEALAEARMDLVNTLLGYPYSICGTIERGHQLGRRIGMPTINLVPPVRKLVPPCGVYYSEVLLEGRNFRGITNIGYKPTVDGSFLGVETYLYGVNEDLYGRRAQVKLLAFRRPEQKFDSVEALKIQMERDIRAGEQFQVKP